MKNILLVAVLTLTAKNLLGQSETNKPKEITFLISGGTSLSGSGDRPGFYVKLGVQKKTKRWNFSLTQSTTIHNGTHPIFFETTPGYINDGSIRFSVTGIELIPAVGYSLISTKRHDFQFSLGAVLRYQSDGDNDSYVLLYPAATGLPMPVLFFTNNAPVNSFAIGPIGQLSYDFRIKPRLKVGVSGSFQFDTVGDNLLNYGLRLGYVLR